MKLSSEFIRLEKETEITLERMKVPLTSFRFLYFSFFNRINGIRVVVPVTEHQVNELLSC